MSAVTRPVYLNLYPTPSNWDRLATRRTGTKFHYIYFVCDDVTTPSIYSSITRFNKNFLSASSEKSWMRNCFDYTLLQKIWLYFIANFKFWLPWQHLLVPLSSSHYIFAATKFTAQYLASWHQAMFFLSGGFVYTLVGLLTACVMYALWTPSFLRQSSLW